MKDNDIKKIFENAVESESGNYTDISAEKIQKTVMERLGKQKEDKKRSSIPEETVEPVYVTAEPKKFPASRIIIASTTAACLGISAIATGFFGLSGNSNNMSALSGDTSAVIEQSDLSQTEKGETTAAGEDAQDLNKGKMLTLHNTFKLLDGTKIVVEDGKVNATDYTEQNNRLLSEENGRVYFWDGEKREDITDFIHMENTFGHAYKNKKSGLIHYVIVGGDVASGKYFYAEAFPLYEKEWHYAVECNEPDTFSSSAEKQQWDNEMSDMSKSITTGMINQICDKNGDERPINILGGGGYTDFKSVTLPEGEDTQNPTDNELPFKNDTFTLLDGTKIVIDDREAIGYYYTDYVDKCLLSEVNGRVYFWNGKVKKDLTDLINTETPYIESYENEGSGLTHYIVIGGDVPSGKYFYAEMFQTNEREWYYASVTNNIFDDCPSTSDDENEQQWYTEMASINVNMVREAIKQVSGVPASSSGGGVTHIDFKTVTLPIPEEEGTQDHRGNKLPLKNDTFNLLDGTKIVVEDDRVSGIYDTLEDDCLLSEVNGRVYFWNGEKKEDITDYIHMENTYGYAYDNDESGLTHYVIVGGDVASGKYFYAEAFQTYEREWHFYAERNDPETFSSRAEEEQWDKEMAEISDSVILSMLNQICDKNGQERPVKYGGGGGDANFKSVTLPCDR